MSCVQDMDSSRFFGSLDSFVQEGDILGRGVANAGFLHALLSADPLDGYHFFLSGWEEIRHLEQYLRTVFPELVARDKIRLATRLELPIALGEQPFHAFHLSDCITSPAWLARLRNRLAQRIFPITAPTHTLSYPRFGAEFLAHLWPGCTARDVVLATSRAGREAVLAQYQWLRDCYGLDATRFPQPSVELLPLGVDAELYRPASEEERLQLRAQWKLPPEKTVLLVLGRISHSSKMDLLPLFRAMQRLLHQGFQAEEFIILLVGALAGTDDYLEKLKIFAQNLGLSIRLVADCSDTDKIGLLQASDMLVSPSDNVQETFGLTLLEAQATGLPVIASDWDGYRDLVEHEVTGLLVPTLGPGETRLADSLGRLWYDNQHHLLLAQGVAVDVAALAQAVGRLTRDPSLRRDMGRAGRERVLEHFHWPRIIEGLVGLWDELWARPVATREALRDIPHPLQPPAGRIFAGYPTHTLPDELTLRWSRLGRAVYRGQDAYSVYAGVQEIVADAEVVRSLLVLARKDISVAELCRRLAETHAMDRDTVRFHILWALKHDLLEPVPPVPEEHS